MEEKDDEIHLFSISALVVARKFPSSSFCLFLLLTLALTPQFIHRCSTLVHMSDSHGLK